MKKFLAILSACVLCLMCVGMFGCGIANGDYVLKEMKVGNTTYSVGQEYNGEELEADYVKLSLKKDNVASLKIGNTTTEGTWAKVENSDEIIIKIGLFEYSAVKDGKQLELKGSLGITYVLVKA